MSDYTMGYTETLHGRHTLTFAEGTLSFAPIRATCSCGEWASDSAEFYEARFAWATHCNSAQFRDEVTANIMTELAKIAVTRNGVARVRLDQIEAAVRTGLGS